jgi:hypothetical protein
LALQIAEHWNEHSIPIVLQQFFAPSRSNHFAGYSNLFTELYKQNNAENSSLELATAAVAKAHFSHLANRMPTEKELVEAYGRALSAIKSTLEDPKERVRDSTILAVWLMGLFEVISNPLLFVFIHLTFI